MAESNNPSKFSLEVEREMRRVDSLGNHIPDPNWKFTDPQGHVHAFDEKGEIPTLEWIAVGTYWCHDCRDEHEEGELRCVQCGFPVQPNYNHTGPQTIYVPGLTEYTLTVDGCQYLLTEEDYKALNPNLPGLTDRVMEFVKHHNPVNWRQEI